MALPQLDATASVILVTLSLWTWTRIKSSVHRSTTDSLGLHRQSKMANISFFLLLLLELCSLYPSALVTRWLLGFGSVSIFLGFSIMSEAKEGCFWSKERNRFFGIAISYACGFLLALLLQEPVFLPLTAGLAISSICRSRFEAELERQSRDLETLQAKLLSEEAQKANERHFRQAN